MIAHLHKPEQIREQAALYAAGALSAAEASEFELHLNSGCATCAAEVASFRNAVGLLAANAPVERPSGNLRSRMVDRIKAEAALRSSAKIDAGGVLFVRSSGLEWEAGPPGIESKVLSLDERVGVSTHLVRMQPGAHYATHRHKGVEELYLLEGDLLVNGIVMKAGDYCRAEPDTIHSGIMTPNGCLFVSTHSIYDEALA